jgi:hypothetical protein
VSSWKVPFAPQEKRIPFAEEGVFILQMANFWNKTCWLGLSLVNGIIQFEYFLVIAKEPRIYQLSCFAGN